MDTVTQSLIVFSDSGVTITDKSGSDVLLHYPDGTDIANGHWYYVALILAQDEATLYLNGIKASNNITYSPVLPPV